MCASSMKYSENVLVHQPAIKLFSTLGWSAVDAFDEFSKGHNILGRSSTSDAILNSNLKAAIQRLNPHINSEAITLAVEELSADRSKMSLVNANKDVYKHLREGVKVTYRNDDGEETTETVNVIDWINPSNNDFLLVSEFYITGEMYKRRADLVGFVNGIPLLFIELKAPHEPIKSAFDNNLSDYKNSVPQLFWPNGVIILSNGSDARIGSVSSSWEHFSRWKRISDEDEQGVISLETMIRGVCEPARFLDMVESFQVFKDTGSGIAKIVAKNHQFLGVNKAIDLLRQISNLPPSDPKAGQLGVFWHTQGSGKSISMIYFAQKIFRKIPGNWTFVIVTDRRELDEQIYKNFVDAGAVTESQAQANSSDDLKRLLSEDHRYIFTLIQKFRTEKGQRYPKISDRSDIIVIADEAHRSQYDTFAMNMRSALPNAKFIGFTGTPLMVGEEKTRQVYGDYVSVYDFKQSIEDGATVPLYYEKRLPELQLTNDDLNEEIYKLIEDSDLDEDQETVLEKQFARQYSLITHEERLETVARDMVAHYMGKDFSSGIGPGKAMFVSIDKATAVKMYDKVQKHWSQELAKLESSRKPGPHDPDSEFERKLRFLKETDMAVVVSQQQNEIEDMARKGVDIRPHRERMVKEHLDYKFKDPDDPFRIVFVCAMWMTGFDVPSCSTIYLDKPMKNHTLMQTIARANRVFPEKNNGLIVDYIGVFRNLQQALAIYSPSEDTGSKPIEPVDDLVEELKKAIQETRDFCGNKNVDLDSILRSEEWHTVAGIDDAVKRLILNDPDSYSDPLDDSVEKILVNNESKQQFKTLASKVRRLFKAIKPHPIVSDVAPICVLIIVIAAKIQSLSGSIDINNVMDEVDDLLTKSVTVSRIRPGQSQVVDLASLDIDKIRERFNTEKKRTQAELLKGSLNSKINQMVRLNKMRYDFHEKLQQLIEDYNTGGVDLETFIDELIKLTGALKEEEKRSVREQLSEEELALFDILTEPEPKLGPDEKRLVKRVASDLIETLKKEKLVLDWRKKWQVRAAVQSTIAEILDRLPETYSKELYEEKCAITYQHIYDNYYGAGRSVYQSAHIH